MAVVAISHIQPLFILQKCSEPYFSLCFLIFPYFPIVTGFVVLPPVVVRAETTVGLAGAGSQTRPIRPSLVGSPSQYGPTWEADRAVPLLFLPCRGK